MLLKVLGIANKLIIVVIVEENIQKYLQSEKQSYISVKLNQTKVR